VGAKWEKTAGAIIERFGNFSCRDILGDNVFNNLLNAFLLQPQLHRAKNTVSSTYG